MIVLRWILWLTGMLVTIFGAAIVLHDPSEGTQVNPQIGIWITLFGISISALVDMIDRNFMLLRVLIRAALMFFMLAIFLLMRRGGG